MKKKISIKSLKRKMAEKLFSNPAVLKKLSQKKQVIIRALTTDCNDYFAECCGCCEGCNDPIVITEQGSFECGSGGSIATVGFDGTCCNFVANPQNAFSQPNGDFTGFQTAWTNASNIEGDTTAFASCDVFPAIGDPSRSQELIGDQFDWDLPADGTIQQAILRLRARGETGSLQAMPIMSIDGTNIDPDLYIGVNTWPSGGFAYSDMTGFFPIGIPTSDASSLAAVLIFENTDPSNFRQVDVQYVEMQLCIAFGEV